MSRAVVDVVIVGGGPAGLSAALLLGRCRRKVVLFDDGSPRNARARAVRAYVGLPESSPAELRRVAHEQISEHPMVELVASRVIDAKHVDDVFEVMDETGRRVAGRKILIATGLRDRLPAVRGAELFWGRGLHSCVFCDGWELRDRPVGVFGSGEKASELARSLLVWSDDVMLFTNGEPAPKTPSQVRVCEERVEAFEGDGEELERVRLANGDAVARAAVFVALGQEPASDLAARLGAKTPGVHVAGDTADGIQLAILAAAEGTKEAHAIHCELNEVDLG